MGQRPRRRAHLPGPDPLTRWADERRHWGKVWITSDRAAPFPQDKQQRPGISLKAFANGFAYNALICGVLLLITMIIRMVLA